MGKHEYKFYSIMRNLGWLAITVLLSMLIFILVGFSLPENLHFNQAFTFIAVGVLIELAIAVIGGVCSIAMGLRRPYSSDCKPHRKWQMFAYIAGSIGAICFVIAIFVIAAEVSRHLVG